MERSVERSAEENRANASRTLNKRMVWFIVILLIASLDFLCLHFQHVIENPARNRETVQSNPPTRTVSNQVPRTRSEPLRPLSVVFEGAAKTTALATPTRIDPTLKTPPRPSHDHDSDKASPQVLSIDENTPPRVRHHTSDHALTSNHAASQSLRRRQSNRALRTGLSPTQDYTYSWAHTVYEKRSGAMAEERGERYTRSVQGTRDEWSHIVPNVYSPVSTTFEDNRIPQWRNSGEAPRALGLGSSHTRIEYIESSHSMESVSSPSRVPVSSQSTALPTNSLSRPRARRSALSSQARPETFYLPGHAPLPRIPVEPAPFIPQTVRLFICYLGLR